MKNIIITKCQAITVLFLMIDFLFCLIKKETPPKEAATLKKSRL